MSGTLTITVPHSLGQAQAIERVKNAFAAAKTRYADKLQVTQEDWSGAHCDFAVAALMQSAGGAIDVADQSITLTAQLPWLLRPFAGQATALIEAHAQGYLKSA